MTTIDEMGRRAARDLRSDVVGVVDTEAGLAAIRSVEAPAQPAAPSTERSRRRWGMVGAGGLVAAGLAALVVLAVRDSDPTPPADTLAPTTSSPATTTSIASTTTSVAPSTTAVPSTTAAATTVPAATDVVGFVPACVEKEAVPPGSPTSDEADVATFGPLGAAPVMEITLPEGRSDVGADLQPPIASVSRIPGGLLVLTRAGSYGYFDGAILTAIDDDGAVRWQRCLASTPNAIARASAAEVLVGSYTDSSATSSTYELLSLADGSPTGTLDQVLAARGTERGDRTEAIWTPTSVVFTHASGHVIDASVDRMLVVDLASLTPSEFEYPEGSDGAQVFAVQLDVSSSGSIVQRGQNWPQVRGVLTPGGWSSEDTDILAASPGDTYFALGQESAELPYLASIDAMGDERWRREDLVGRPHEGFTVAVSDGVVVGRGCHVGDSCEEDSVFFGLDAETGETLWEHDAAAAATVIGDGVMIVTEGGDSGWTMLDVATGEPVAADQVWSDPSAFSQECCGDGDFVHVGRLGGIVVSVNGTNVSVWYPAAVSQGTVSIQIP